MELNDETNNTNEHSMVKNPHWQVAGQLAICKDGREKKRMTEELN